MVELSRSLGLAEGPPLGGLSPVESTGAVEGACWSLMGESWRRAVSDVLSADAARGRRALWGPLIVRSLGGGER